MPISPKRLHQKWPSKFDLGSKKTFGLRLRLSGFSQQDHATIDEIIEIIDLLPTFHLVGLQDIEYLSDSEASKYLGVKRSFSIDPKAEFLQRERKILIYRIEARNQLFHVLFHEIGHYVYSIIINSSLKQYWVTQVHPESVCVSKYGSTSAAEDFAETYAFYIINPNTLKLIPEKYSFMHNLVFSGSPITLKEAKRNQDD